MASVEKYTQNAVYSMLRHNERTSATHSNPNIHSDKSKLNYRLSDERECTDYDFFKQQLTHYKCMNRPDIIKMASWIVTAPENLPIEQEREFFECCHAFLKQRYGTNNELQCIVHYDEIHTFIDPKTGQIKESRPHLHYCFIPAITDKKGDLHICAKKVLTRTDLRNFHTDLQRYLNQNGIQACIYSGITKQNGGNVSVKELKSLSNSFERTYTNERGFEF